MGSMFKNILKYIITLALGVSLLWYLVNAQSEEGKQNIVKGFVNADYFWIMLTVVIALFEKVVRAYRWNLLMEPLSYKPALKNTLIAVLVGYFANIFAPRMGEVARCGMLKKTDDIPINASFGTVVLERVVDFLCLLLIIPFALMLEFQKISELLQRTAAAINESFSKSYLILVLAAVCLFITGILVFVFRERLKQNKIFVKVREFLTGIFVSLTSIRKLKKKSQFLACTLTIWVCYFLMTYLAFFSLEATAMLDISAGLIVLVVGGLGMSAPVQAGIGAFHGIVKETLEQVYLISDQWALPYAFVVWGSQTATVFVAGLIALIIAFGFTKKTVKKASPELENQVLETK